MYNMYVLSGLVDLIGNMRVYVARKFNIHNLECLSMCTLYHTALFGRVLLCKIHIVLANSSSIVV